MKPLLSFQWNIQFEVQIFFLSRGLKDSKFMAFLKKKNGDPEVIQEITALSGKFGNITDDTELLKIRRIRI